MQSIVDVSRQIRRSLVFLSLLGLFALGVALSTYSYYDHLRSSQDHVLQRLKSVAMTLRPHIPLDLYRKLMEKYTKKDSISTTAQDPDYKRLHKMLLQAQKSNDIQTPIYTMIRRKGATLASRKNSFYFGITSAVKPYFRHPYTPPVTLFSQYKKGGVMRPYGDKHGQWLSAFVPLSDAKGQIGVLQVDMKFDRFRRQAREKLINHVLISLGIFLFVSILLLRFVFKTTSALQFHHDKHQRNQQFQEDVVLDNQALQETVSTLTDIIDNFSDGLLVTDEDGLVIHINPTFVEMFGDDVAGVLGRRYDRACPKEMAALLEQAGQFQDQIVRQRIPIGIDLTTEAVATAMFRTELDGGEPRCVGLLLAVRLPVS